MDPRSAEALAWLASEAGEAAFKAASAASEQRQSLALLVARLRKTLSAEQAHAVLDQLELRERATVKFPEAARMLFDRTLLEQATDAAIAQYKAARFAAGEPVVDLCCGLGGDLFALAARGPTTGVDRDDVAAWLARENCRRLGLNQAQVAVGDAAHIPVAQFAAWHMDPDRRAAGKRTNLPELFEPPLRDVERLIQENGNAAIKLGPATDAPTYWSEACELEWIGSRGECRQQVAWFGTLARHPRERSATVLAADGSPLFHVVGLPNIQLPIASQLGRYLYEPEATVLAARLQGSLGARHSLELIQPGIGYLTGDAVIADPALAGFEILEQLPLDVRRLRGWLRERHIGRVEIKKRGVTVEPETLRKSLKLSGDERAVIILTPQTGRQWALIAQRLERRDES
jgi:hypothetical protein